MITDEQKAHWVWLMRSYPGDGYPGAGDLRASHDSQVKEYERELAAIDPGWREQMPDWRR